jgi:hypothetical protein
MNTEGDETQAPKNGVKRANEARMAEKMAHTKDLVAYESSVVDPHHIDADPDADPDST